LEGITFGPGVEYQGQKLHMFWVANDNDFEQDFAGSGTNPNQFFVFWRQRCRSGGIEVRTTGSLTVSLVGHCFQAFERKGRRRGASFHFRAHPSGNGTVCPKIGRDYDKGYASVS
jgi:hypothetical protein